MSGYLWLRMGDAGKYERFESILEVANELYLNDVESDFTTGDQRTKIFSDGYGGDNYISVYHGDRDADMIEGLPENEVARIRKFLIEKED